MASRRKGSSDNGRSMQQRVRNEQERLAERLSERAEELADQAESLAHQAQEMAINADRRVRRVVDRRPMTAIWTSFGLGLGLGLVLVAVASSRSRDEEGWSLDDLSGSLGDLSRRASAIGRSVAHQASDYAQDFGKTARRRVRDVAGSLGW